MRKIIYNGESVDYTAISKLSENYDKTHAREDTEYIIINAAVLGNATGRAEVNGDDRSSALAAIHGRKYNNARVALPFTRKYVEEHYSELDSVVTSAANKMSGKCAELQSKLTPEQMREGREVSMRSMANRKARQRIEETSPLDPQLFNESNRGIRGQASSKVYFEHGLAVSGRRVQDTDPIESKKGKTLYKKKSITTNSGAQMTGWVATADESGLKKVPIFSTEMRKEAEEYVFKFARIVKEAVDSIGEEVDGDKVLECLKTIESKLEGDPTKKIEIDPFSDAEEEQIEVWANEIYNNYMHLS